jgi:hypothetical protein
MGEVVDLAFKVFCEAKYNTILSRVNRGLIPPYELRDMIQADPQLRAWLQQKLEAGRIKHQSEQDSA